jgi:hypothetical protein
MPEGAIAIVKEQVTRLTQTSNSALGLGFFLGLALALWSANAGMKAVIDALNVVYDEREERGFVKLTLVALAFTLGSLAFIILALGAVVAFPLALAWIGFESRAGAYCDTALAHPLRHRDAGSCCALPLWPKQDTCPLAVAEHRHSISHACLACDFCTLLLVSG